MMFKRSRYPACFLVIIMLTASLLIQDAGKEASAQLREGEDSEFEFRADEKAKKVDEGPEMVSPYVPEADPNVVIMEDRYTGQYVSGTLQNLSKLYWRLHVFDGEDDKAIDNFLMINECDIYRAYIRDDFEWQDIRNAAKAMLAENKDTFPLKFKFILPVDLGRYDTENKGFSLVGDTAFKNMRRIEISGNSIHRPVCGVKGDIKDYPRNLILILNKPFTYDFVSVDEQIAQAYIMRRKYESDQGTPPEFKNLKYDRMAYVRIRVVFSRYQGNIRGRQNQTLAVLYGKLDGLDVFEDPYEKQLLTSIDF